MIQNDNIRERYDDIEKL